MKKTNVARFLDQLNIDYRVIEYVVDKADLSATSVARQIGYPAQQVFKTLVARGDKNGLLVCCIPGCAELDLKCVAVLSGNKRVVMIKEKELLEQTGYVRGGVSPLVLKKQLPVYLDESAVEFSEIVISAGQRGLQLALSPKSLLQATKATVAHLITTAVYRNTK